jgi:hypothetical protein
MADTIKTFSATRRANFALLDSHLLPCRRSNSNTTAVNCTNCTPFRSRSSIKSAVSNALSAFQQQLEREHRRLVQQAERT